MLGNTSHYFKTDQVNLALYFNAATFVVSALTIFALREIPRRRGEISAPSVAKTIVEGWRYIGQTRVVRGIVIGMVGAFAAAGVVVGLGQVYVTDTLHGGQAGWGVVFAAIFVGLALGMFVGLRILRGFSRRRLFGLSISVRGDPAGPDRADPRTSRWSRSWSSCSARARAWPTSPGTRSSAARWTTRPAAGRSRSCSRPCGSSCSP